MDKGWYFRFSMMAVVSLLGWFILWPSLDSWLPAPAPIRTYFTGRRRVCCIWFKRETRCMRSESFL